MTATPRPRIAAPERLVRAVAAAEQAGAAEWLAGLPELAAAVLAEWELTPERVQAPGGRSSLLVLVRQPDGTRAALKLALVTERTAQEHAALARWDGRGAVRLLRADPDRGALLLERLQGDVSLRSLPEAKAMLEAADGLQRLWVDPAADGGHPFTTVPERTGRLAGELRSRREEPYAAEVRPLVDEALAQYGALAGSGGSEVLLHGDYHQGNVLAGVRAPWLAIDPQPLAGERAYDVATLVRDRVDTLVAAPGGAAAARRRVARLADLLEVDGQRLRGWALFRAVAAGAEALGRGERRRGELLMEFAGWL